MSDEHPQPSKTRPVTPIGDPARWPEPRAQVVDRGRLSLEEVAALVECASGADASAITALEGVVADLRRAAAAREELAAHVPPLMLKQVLLARAADVAGTSTPDASTADASTADAAGAAGALDPRGERS